MMPSSPSYISQILDTAMESPRFLYADVKEIAFYGGTFTNLPPTKMKVLLEATRPYLQKGVFDSIRISTRPDCIYGEILELIKNYGVTTVELGVQSMDDTVLVLSKRGHTSDDVIKAVSLLKRYGFKVGIQLMPGLPGDSESIFNDSIEKIIALNPDMARLYPAIVIRDTELASMYLSGQYSPLALYDAVRICGESCLKLEGNNIPVIRIGLMSSPSLLSSGEILGGPWHSAFGFLVRSYMYHKKITAFLARFTTHAEIGIRAPKKEIPLLRGYRNEGIRRIEERSGVRVVYVKHDDSIPSGRIEVDEIK